MGVGFCVCVGVVWGWVGLGDVVVEVGCVCFVIVVWEKGFEFLVFVVWFWVDEMLV